MTREASLDITKLSKKPVGEVVQATPIDLESMLQDLENWKGVEANVVDEIGELANQGLMTQTKAVGHLQDITNATGAATGAMADLDLPSGDVSPGAITSTPSIQTGEYRVADASGNLPGSATTTVPKVSIPSVQVDPGDTQKPVAPYSGKPSTQLTNQFDREMKSLRFYPADAPDAFTVAQKRGTGDPSEFLNQLTPTFGSKIEAPAVETTVPGADGGSLLDAINYRGPTPGLVEGKGEEFISGMSQEQALRHTGESGFTPISRGDPASTSIINTLIGMGIRPPDATRLGDMALGVIFGGESPVKTFNNTKSIIDSWDYLNPAQKLSAGNYMLGTGSKLAGQVDRNLQGDNWKNLVGDKFKEIGDNISTVLGGAKNILFNPEDALKEYGAWIKYGDGTTRIKQDLINGESVYTLNNKGELATPSLWPLKPFIDMTPVGAFMSLTDKILGMTGAKAERAKEALAFTDAVGAGGHEVVINDKHYEDTNIGIYGNGTETFFNVGLRVLGGPAEVLNINFNLGKIDPDTKLTDVTDVALRNAMVGGVSPYDPEHAEQATRQLREQFIAASKVLKSGGTIGGLKNAGAKLSDRPIRLQNSLFNKASGYDFIKEEDMGRYNIANRDISKMNYVMSQTRGQKAPEIVHHSKQLGDLDDKPAPAPAPVTSGATGPPGRNYSDDPVHDPGPAADYPSDFSAW